MTPRLAIGSRRSFDGTITDETGILVSCSPPSSYRAYLRAREPHNGYEVDVWAADALAAIRSAGLDSVWTATVELIEAYGSSASAEELLALLDHLGSCLDATGEPAPNPGLL